MIFPGGGRLASRSLSIFSSPGFSERNPYLPGASTFPYIHRGGFRMPDQDCQQCGRCCERWGWGQKGIPEDLLPWLTSHRRDILQHVSIRYSDGTWASGSKLTAEDLPRVAQIRYWQDPGGRPLHHCPFLRRSADGKARCGIHDCKPAVCQEFTPWTWKNHEFYGNCPACQEKAP